MLLMKKDMGGAACVLALARMVMESSLPVRLRVLVPAVENAIAGNAYRPGDVLRTRKGISVEVGNTDAEGRLVLADALALADAEATGPAGGSRDAHRRSAHRPRAGTAGRVRHARRDGRGAGATTGAGSPTRFWPMPLWAGYDDEITSRIADLNKRVGLDVRRRDHRWPVPASGS